MLLLCAGALLVGAHVPGHIGNYIEGTRICGEGRSPLAESAVDPVSHNYPIVPSDPPVIGLPATLIAAHADASRQTVRAFARANPADEVPGDIFGSTCVTIKSSIVNQVTIDPGTSGLPTGTGVTLRLSVEASGSATADDRRPSIDGFVPVEADGHLLLSYKVVDTAIFGSARDLVEVSALVRSQYNTAVIAVLGEQTSRRREWSYRLENNFPAPVVITDQFLQSLSCPDYADLSCEGFPGVASSLATVNMDTGVQTIDFNTKVGAVLSLEGWLVASSSAREDENDEHAIGEAAFIESFQADITSPDEPGLALIYALPAPNPTPVPLFSAWGLVALFSSLGALKLLLRSDTKSP
jgi:hypothetical protein